MSTKFAAKRVFTKNENINHKKIIDLKSWHHKYHKIQKNSNFLLTH